MEVTYLDQIKFDPSTNTDCKELGKKLAYYCILELCRRTMDNGVTRRSEMAQANLQYKAKSGAVIHIPDQRSHRRGMLSVSKWTNIQQIHPDTYAWWKLYEDADILLSTNSDSISLNAYDLSRIFWVFLDIFVVSYNLKHGLEPDDRYCDCFCAFPGRDIAQYFLRANFIELSNGRYIWCPDVEPLFYSLPEYDKEFFFDPDTAAFDRLSADTYLNELERESRVPVDEFDPIAWADTNS